LILEFGEFLVNVFYTIVNMLNSTSVWMVVSFGTAGIARAYLNPERMRKSSIGSTKLSGILWTTFAGTAVPICSCGSTPLGVSLYYSGAYLGPTLAFMTSTPVLNPVAIILTWGLLGKEVAIINIAAGLIMPIIVGIIGNKFAGDELHLKDLPNETERKTLIFEEPTHFEKIKDGLKWSFTELAVTISKYTVSGVLLAGVIIGSVPQSIIQNYLGNPGFITLFGITVVAALMYVCAVGHIPMIAALVASGASPGIAITFLMAGAATNIPELLTIYKTIGKRAMLMFLVTITVLSNVAGYITNLLLVPGYTPILDYDATSRTINTANKFIMVQPDWLQYTCSAILVAYALHALYKQLKGEKAKGLPIREIMKR
jgi:uncharacterized membrane protein YraQ (UPF0718 family)